MKATQILELYVKVFPEVVKDRWKTDSCLAAAAVTLRVLGLYAIQARAVPVQLTAYNIAWRERLERGEPLPETREAIRAWAAAGCFSVGIGFKGEATPANKWDGHMVVVTESLLLPGPMLLDLTLKQASRPDKDLLLPATFLTPATLGFLEGEAPLIATNHAGVMLCYQNHPAPPPWEQTPDWRPHRHDVVEIGLVRALERQGVPLAPAEPFATASMSYKKRKKARA